jgi:hypothetical protein
VCVPGDHAEQLDDYRSNTWGPPDRLSPFSEAAMVLIWANSLQVMCEMDFDARLGKIASRTLVLGGCEDYHDPGTAAPRGIGQEGI